MERHWSVVCVLVVALCAYLHFDTASADEADGCSTAKPGRCPRRKWGAGLCAEFCQTDSDCPNEQKCCSNGCGHQCMEPNAVKHGRCPKPQRTHMCAEFCVHDGQCPEKQKCCRTTCGKACTDPK
ncbi:WAP four-disulfide core domain protein 3 [Cynoglossus semilaevis]|uniref:WAP four-disulfide core domain 2 n=1 Tax=Cynoglossus semilaevis TaxID=244447 RepID=A0A3P8V263_CYNSE|nr:WAP four-disulfide core domain protein 2-like [Cynoglossus semilaevis]